MDIQVDTREKHVDEVSKDDFVVFPDKVKTGKVIAIDRFPKNSIIQDGKPGTAKVMIFNLYTLEKETIRVDKKPDRVVELDMSMTF